MFRVDNGKRIVGSQVLMDEGNKGLTGSIKLIGDEWEIILRTFLINKTMERPSTEFSQDTSFDQIKRQEVKPG